MFNKKLKNIEFISTVEGLESIEECLPKPAKYFIPKWFKNIPSENIGTIKSCPGIVDYFSQGYIIPMWCDSILQKDENGWRWQTSNDKFSWSIHDNNQFLDYSNIGNFNSENNFIFKTNCPWRIITPPGWSVLQLPLFYNYEQDWSVLPGVIDTDIYTEINQQVLYRANGKEIKIKHGQPLALYIPFKRSNKLKHKVRYKNKKDNLFFEESRLRIASKFHPNGKYRELQRKRDQ